MQYVHAESSHCLGSQEHSIEFGPFQVQESKMAANTKQQSVVTDSE